RARREPDLGVLALLRHELGDPAGGAHELRAAAGLELDPVDLRAGRDVLERHAVPKTRFRIGPREHAVTDLQIERRQDVPLLAVLVAEEREPGRAIRVVLDRDHLRRDAALVAFKIDDPLGALRAAAAVTHRHAALRVAAAGTVLRL